jgi:hypothetical protein
MSRMAKYHEDIEDMKEAMGWNDYDEQFEDPSESQFVEYPGAQCAVEEDGKIVRYEFTEEGRWVSI